MAWSVLQIILGSAEADSAVACAEACEAVAGCNGASYYPDAEAYFGKIGVSNCWMKTFSDTCDKPAGAMVDDLAVLILKPSADCTILCIEFSAITVLLFAVRERGRGAVGLMLPFLS